jgi:hypothetical protein
MSLVLVRGPIVSSPSANGWLKYNRYALRLSWASSSRKTRNE